MKAYICQEYGPPEVLKLREIEKPSISAEQILVQSGAIRPPIRPLDESFWTMPRPEDPEGLVLAELLRQRGSSRVQGA